METASILPPKPRQSLQSGDPCCCRSSSTLAFCPHTPPKTSCSMVPCLFHASSPAPLFQCSFPLSLLIFPKFIFIIFPPIFPLPLPSQSTHIPNMSYFKGFLKAYHFWSLYHTFTHAHGQFCLSKVMPRPV